LKDILEDETVFFLIKVAKRCHLTLFETMFWKLELQIKDVKQVR